MKAKTLRPLTIILLFGFLSTNGWMIVRDGADHTITRSSAPGSTLAGAGAQGDATGPAAAAIPPPLGAGPLGAPYAAPSASSTPGGGQSASYGASGGPAAAPRTSPGPDDPILVTADSPSNPTGGFGDFSIPGALPAAEASTPRAGRGDPGAGPSSSHSGSGSGGDSSGLLDPPGAITAPGSGGGNSIGGDGNRQVIVGEPSTLALFLAGAVGLALRRRHPAR